MKPEDFPAIVTDLCAAGAWFGRQGWCLATGGNFSARVDDSHCLITQSGREKSSLSAIDLMLCDFDGNALDAGQDASAETPLHTKLYKLDDRIGAVLHTHSVAATLLSQLTEKTVVVSGYEMQKAIAGIKSHEDTLSIPVFENDQDMQALAQRVERAWSSGELNSFSFLVRGHGLYAWGENVFEARRHIEGLEFLLECEHRKLATNPK